MKGKVAITAMTIGVSAALLAACGGGGGGGASTSSNPSSSTSSPTPASTPSVKATPITVQPSSYLNKVTAAAAIGPQSLPSEVAAGNAVAFADFFQDGTYSMVTHTCGDTNCGGNGQPGTIHFYKNVNGQWVDHTSDILSNNVGCLHPRKAIVADFNGSEKPGVFFACHGLDASPFPGEQPHLLLPQSDGTYKNITLPFTGFFHSASAADFGGKGFADIVVADPLIAGTPYFLINNGDGTFTKSTTRLPSVIKYGTNGSQPDLTCTSNCAAQIYTTELIDFNNTGKYDLFLGGTAPDSNSGNWIPTIFKNNGDNTYSQTNVTELPYNPTYELALDVLSVNGAVYTTNVHLNTSGPLYGFSDIEKDVGSNSSQLWVGNSNFSNGQSWINWIIPYQGKIDAIDSTYGVSVSQ
ncbi:VCBS repeat-containing protein [Burkholderia pseudomallei]|uniref:VCBS repeat-containing protein n=1 Tax=Burkholderia pseudomallei TaxID=28450 RepID=UPI0011CD835C|nr:VCBS repeat-containing protein [Burkholderia pseudomallei]